MARGWFGRWRSADVRPATKARKSGTRLRLEQLEEVVLLSAAPADISLDELRELTFSVVPVEQSLVSWGELQAQGSASLELIGADVAVQQYGYKGTGYSVAVIDTGVDYTHPGLTQSYLGGWDFIDDDADPMDEDGHGTHVAGIIASRYDSRPGIASEVNVIALRVLDGKGEGTYGDVEDALQWVVEHREQYNIVAVNLSLGSGNHTTNPRTLLEDEFQNLESRGVFLSVASGNDFYTYNSRPGLSYPAISSHAVSVGAVWDANYGSVAWSGGERDYSTAPDRVVSFTQRSGQLSLMAPGTRIVSTFLGGGFASMSGTSMAAPIVTGAAVLLRQALDSTGQQALANQDHMLSVMRATGVTLVDGDDENDNVTNTGSSFKRLDLRASLASIVTAGVNPEASKAIVRELYSVILARAPDASGLASWVAALQSGMSRSQVVEALWNSAEHRALEAGEYYRTFFGRTASAAELRAWVEAFQRGASEDSVIRQFLTSSEYGGLHADDRSFIEALYRQVIGRRADEQGIAWWQSLLEGGLSRTEVVDRFLASGERYLRAVDGYYETLLDRTAASSEVAWWAASISRGESSLPRVAQAFLASQEYYDRAIRDVGL